MLTQVVGTARQQTPELVDRRDPVAPRRALRDEKRADRLHLAVPSLRQRSRTARLSRASGTDGIERIDLPCRGGLVGQPCSPQHCDAGVLEYRVSPAP